MATNDLNPLFFSDHAEEPEQLGIGKAWDTAATSSRILKTNIPILVVTAAAVFLAMLLVENPLPLFANATASLVATSEDDARQPTPSIQSTAIAEALPPTPSEAPRGDEIAAAIKIAYQSLSEIRQPPADALSLFEEFQAWAAEEDARARVGPVQPVQDARAQVVYHHARAQTPPPQTHRHVRRLHSARADVRAVQKHRVVRSVQNARTKVRPVHNARQIRPEQDAQVQDRSVQNAQATTWSERHFGWLYPTFNRTP
jgi:hypothetical protein